MIHVQTRQNRKGNWWCNTTVDRQDYCFEDKSMDLARSKMADLLNSLQIKPWDIVWQEPKLYSKEDKSNYDGEVNPRIIRKGLDNFPVA